MNSELKDFLESYQIIFDATQGLALAVFGACLFLVVRRAGLIHDKDIKMHGGVWPLGIAATLAVVAVITSLLSIGAVQNAYSLSYKYEYQTEVWADIEASERDELEKRRECESSLTGEIVTGANPSHFFDECIRGPIVAPLIGVTMFATAMSVMTLFFWFIFQILPRKAENDADTEKKDTDDHSGLSSSDDRTS